MDGKVLHFDTLKKILKRQVHLHKELLDLVRKEREALIATSIEQIKELTFAKEAMVFEVQSVENDRKKWIARLQREFNLSNDSLDLESVIKVLGVEYREELFRLKTSILTLAGRIKEISLNNKELTLNALRDANSMKQNALGISSINQTYGSNGKVEDNGKSARLISKEV